MRGVRRTNARNKVFNKRTKPHSSLSSLPSANSKNNNMKPKYKRNTRKSIQKTPEKSNKYTNKHKHEQKEIEEYDSTDSLDQLLDNSFMPNRIIKSNQPKNTPPRKNIKSSVGNKRSKAMALMASNMKSQRGKSYNKKDAKKQYNNICNELKYKTPYLNNNNKIHSNYTSLRKSRKIITPYYKNNNVSYINALNINDTPKILLKGLQTPCTPTPIKLMKHLNVKTPKTNNNNVKRKLSLRDDDNIVENDKNKINEIENSVLKKNKNYIETESWNNVPYTPRNDGNKNGRNKKENDSNNVSEFDRLILCTKRLQLPLKFLGLLNQFNALESTLALKMRKNNFFVHFQNIEKSVTQITKKRFTQRVFQQILNVLPEFYHVQWTAYTNKGAGITKKELRLTVTAVDCEYDNLVKNDNDENGTKKKEKSRDIGIRFLKVSKLKEREGIFRLKLYEYIRSIHKQHLIDNILVEFDPFISGNWHRNFDLENIKDINIHKLPLKPVKNTNEMEKMITEQKEQMEFILEKEIELIKKQRANNELPKYLRGLSPTYIAKIRAKDKNRKKNCAKINAKTENFDENKNRLKQLSYLVNLIRGIYVSLKKGSMSCNDLIKIIKKRHRNQFILNGEIWKQLQILNQLKSKFFVIKQGPRLKVGKLNKKVDVKEVFDEINEKIKQ